MTYGQATVLTVLTAERTGVLTSLPNPGGIGKIEGCS